MAATTESVKADAAEAPLLNVKNMVLGSLLYILFYGWVRWYEGVYGWSAGHCLLLTFFYGQHIMPFCTLL